MCLTECHCIKGIALYNLNKHNLAVDAFNKAIELNPSNADFYFNKSLPLYSLGKYDEALEGINKALELNPDHAGAKEMKKSLLKEKAK
ncbi:MAG TPA: tetratricopeptide repeat protein [Rickettsia endosymbiont of Bembidion nr. Transversale]|nr:tetratricopeptide repeat protein [Rickettsia endosymbiont of Bembidion nr. Transversale]